MYWLHTANKMVLSHAPKKNFSFRIRYGLLSIQENVGIVPEMYRQFIRRRGIYEILG
jgi:hypothetical protein